MSTNQIEDIVKSSRRESYYSLAVIPWVCLFFIVGLCTLDTYFHDAQMSLLLGWPLFILLAFQAAACLTAVLYMILRRGNFTYLLTGIVGGVATVAYLGFGFM